MKKSAIATALLLVSGTVHAATGEFCMFDVTGAPVSDGTWGTTCDTAVSATINTIGTAGSTISSTNVFFGTPWTAHSLTTYSAGTYTVATGNGDYTFTVGANQIGVHMLFNWGASTDIDVVNIWDVNVAGDGTITYTSTDWDGDGTLGGDMIDGPFIGFSANFNLTSTDTLPPIITRTGNATVSVGTNDAAYVDAGATAVDQTDIPLPTQPTVTVTTSGTVNQAVPGDYTLTYNASDAAGNTATPVTRTVTIFDNTLPVITLNGSATISIGAGSSYTDAGATASDNVDGDITGSIVVGGDTVNTAVPGTYVITYDVSDAATNAATQVTRTVTVTNGEPPVITLVGGNVSINEGDTYTDAGATASDPEDGVIDPTSIVVVNPVNTAVPGVYIITYNVTDSVGNPATEVTRTVTVNDITVPVITLNTGDDSVGTNDTAWVDAGATVTDNVDATRVIMGSGTVDQTTPGNYTITYATSDAAGNVATSVTRTVSVFDNTPPVITLTGSASVSIAAGLTYTDAGATATDNVDGSVTTNIVVGGDTVDTSVPGTYVITYNVSDAASNAAIQVTRTVTVTAGNPPVITLLGDANVYLNEGDTYVDAGATASDTEDGVINPTNIVVVNPVDTTTPGIYTITYNVSDSAGNPATQVTRTVTVYESSVQVSVIPPELTATQNSITSRIIVTSNGNVTISTDLDASNTFDWSATTQVAEIGGITNAQTFTFDPSGLADGLYEVKVTVNATTDSEASASLLLKVVTTAPALTTADSDGDGVDDATEGFGDTDEDGIPDYLDSSMLTAGQISAGTKTITSSTGSLRLGNTAFAAGNITTGNVSALIGANDVVSFGGIGATSVSNGTDTAVQTCVGGCFDFEVSGLAQGEVIQLVIHLNAGIPANAHYRLYTQSLGWHDFTVDSINAIASAAATVNGVCPAVNASGSWVNGLFEGDTCIRLTVQDGGPNDADGLANGMFIDPAGVAEITPTSTVNTADNDETIGCSATSTPVNPLHRSDWLLIAAFLAFLAINRIRHTKH